MSVTSSENPYPDGAIVGSDENDLLIGERREENAIFGEDGHDLIIGGRRSDFVDGGEGDDLVLAGRGADIIHGGAGSDLLIGGRGSDSINGDEGNDLLFGGRGRDILSGGEGDDLLYGGRGSDTFIFRDGDGEDVIVDYAVGSQGRRFRIAGDEIQIEVEGVNNFDDLMGFAAQDGGNVVFDFGEGDALILASTQLAALDRDAFTFF